MSSVTWVTRPLKRKVPQWNWTSGGGLFGLSAGGWTNRRTAAVRLRTSTPGFSAVSYSRSNDRTDGCTAGFCRGCALAVTPPASALFEYWSFSDVGLNWTSMTCSGPENRAFSRAVAAAAA